MPMKSDTLKEAGVVDGIMMWIAVAILLVIFLPVIAAVQSATAMNASAPLYSTEVALTSMTASSYGLLIVVLIVLAAVILLGVIAYLRGGKV